MTVFSRLMVRGNTSAGDPVYTCPVGKVAVLRCVDVYNNSAILAELFLEDATTGQAIARFDNVVNLDGTPGATSHQWTGRQVFDENEGFLFHATAGVWDVRASGYELAAP